MGSDFFRLAIPELIGCVNTTAICGVCLCQPPSALSPQKNTQPSVAESRTLRCQLPQPSPQRNFVPLSPRVTPAPSLHPDQPTGVSLAQPCFFPHNTHHFALSLRAYHFFDSTTFSAPISSACCATTFSSRPFSSSSWRSRRASFTSKLRPSPSSGGTSRRLYLSVGRVPSPELRPPRPSIPRGECAGAIRDLGFCQVAKCRG